MNRRGGSGADRRLAASTSNIEPRNGSRPVIASYSIVPTAYQSEAAVSEPPEACSGAMYSTVPNHSPPVSAEVVADLELERQAEIEDDHTALAGDHDVGRLEVAVQATRTVQRAKRAGELTSGRRDARELAERRQGIALGAGTGEGDGRPRELRLGAVDLAVGARRRRARAVLARARTRGSRRRPPVPS